MVASRVPYLRNGVTPAGSRIVCPRSERRFSVPVWVRYAGQFMVGPDASVCGVSAPPVPQGVLPGGPRCVRELRLSLAPSSVLHCPLLVFSVASTTLAAGLGLSWVPCSPFCRGGFCPSVGGSAFALQPLAPSSRVILTVAASLGRFLVLSLVLRWASVCFQVHLLCSASFSWVFFGLGAFSFGCGFGLCLTFLLESCGCRCACCDPPCGCESVGVLPSLLGPFPFRGLSPFSRLFLSWRPCRSRSLIPSLAPSWWWPCPLLRWALLTLSGYVLSVPSAVSLRRSRCSILSHCRPSCTVSWLTVSVLGVLFAYPVGRLPLRWFRRGPWGFAVAPPLSPCTGPGWSPPICRVALGLRSVFLIFLCDLPHVYMAIILSVSLTRACPYLVIPLGYCSLDT